jgi:hypothetical protein
MSQERQNIIIKFPGHIPHFDFDTVLDYWLAWAWTMTGPWPRCV